MISRSTTSPSSRPAAAAATRTLAIRPFQTSSVPTRSNAIDLLCQNGATGKGGAKEQLVLVDFPPHRRRGQARATIAIEVDGDGAPPMTRAGQLDRLRQGDVHG